MKNIFKKIILILLTILPALLFITALEAQVISLPIKHANKIFLNNGDNVQKGIDVINNAITIVTNSIGQINGTFENHIIDKQAHGIPAYTGQGAKYLRLNTGETFLEFENVPNPDLTPYALKTETDSLENGIGKLNIDKADTKAVTLKADLTYVNSLHSYKNDALNKTFQLYDLTADVILETSGAGDLNAAVAALAEGQLLEVKTNATYSPITIPANKALKIRAAHGYSPVLTGQECIKVSNGARDVIISGLIVDTCTSSYQNARGSAISFPADYSIANNIIFHNITIRNCTGSGAILAYNNYNDYALAPTLEQFSNKIAFINCRFHKATTDATEGAALSLRGVNMGLIYNCYIDSVLLGRGIAMQDCTNFLIENNTIVNCGNSNGEGIKIDALGTPIGYRNTGIIKANIVKNCIEGIDVDDIADCTVIDNIVSNSSLSAIGLDDSSTADIIGNTCYNSNNGIRLEVSSVANLKKNVCFNNTTNYKIENGYVYDDSNTSEMANTTIGADSIPYKNSTSALVAKQVQSAIDELAANKTNKSYVDTTDEATLAAMPKIRSGHAQFNSLAGRSIIFSTPMADVDYQITITPENDELFDIGAVSYKNKTANGFDVINSGENITASFDYTAIKK